MIPTLTGRLKFGPCAVLALLLVLPGLARAQPRPESDQPAVTVSIAHGQVLEEPRADSARLVQKELCPDRPFTTALPPVSVQAFRRFYSRSGLRLEFTPERLKQIREAVAADPHLRLQQDCLLAQAEELLVRPLPAYEPSHSTLAAESPEHAGQIAASSRALGDVRNTCALCYALTGDERFAREAWEAFEATIYHFYTYGVLRMAFPWQSPWDEGLELYDAAAAYDLITRWDGLRPVEHALAFTYLRRLGERVAYAVELSPVLGGEQAVWTCHLGCLCLYAPDMPEAPRWAKLVAERLTSVLEDFMPDGGHIECDPQVQATALRALWRYARLRARNGDDALLRKPWDESGLGMERAFDWFARIATPLGTIPALHDSLPLPLAGNAEFMEALGVFGRGDWLRAARADPAGLGLFDPALPADLPPRDPRAASVLLPDTGLAVMRDGWAETDAYLLLQYGRHGGPHGHADKLSFVLYAQGQPWVLDAGAAPDPVAHRAQHEAWHRQTIAHNTVLVDQESQDPADGQLVVWHTGPRYDLVAAEHTGNPEMLHRRTVFHPRGGYFLVFDELANAAQRSRDLEWLLHVYGRRESGTIGRMLFWREGGFGLSVVPAAGRGLRGAVVGDGLCSGCDDSTAVLPPGGDYSGLLPGQPGWAMIPFIGFKAQCPPQDTGALCVALIPFKDVEPETTLNVTDSDLAYGIELRSGATRDRLLIRRREAGPGSARCLGLVTDGKCAFVRQEGGQITMLEVAEGESLTVEE